MTKQNHQHKPMLLNLPSALTNGKSQKPCGHYLSTLFVPIVPITHLLKAIAISNKGKLGMYKRIYARKSFNPLGIAMSTRGTNA